MPKPRLNGAQRDSVLLPAGRARLAESVQVDVLANRMRLAGDFAQQISAAFGADALRASITLSVSATQPSFEP